MLLEDNCLLRKRELLEEIVLKQIKSMNLPVFKYRLVSLTVLAALLDSKRHLQVERQ